ncbi:MAG: T9SS type A sorting domain-containing protein [Ferruginibacter sp.]
MKKLIFTAFIITCMLQTKCFSQAIIADPAVNTMRTTSVASLPVNADAIPIDSIISIKIPVINYNLNNPIPSGTCKIKIGLGSKLILDPSFNLNTVNTSNYFTWTALVSGGQLQITGDLIATLPANYLDTVTFNVKGTILGNSTITTNFLITNHNSVAILSDENGSNNNAGLPYTIIARPIGPVPVTFTKVMATKENCNVKVNFDAENEINVSRYEIELSKDAIHFEKIGLLNANNRIKYFYSFAITENIKADQIFLRIKSVDKDDKFQYSETKKIAGTCIEKNQAVILFPNPVSQDVKQIAIQSKDVFFNGNYTIHILDMAGKLLETKNIRLTNTKQFNLETANLSKGQYIIQLLKQDGTHNINLKLQKL